MVGRPAAAQRADVEANASFNVGFSQTTQRAFQTDPAAQPEDIPQSSKNLLFTELRPGIAAASGTPRVAWRAGYVFAGTLNFVDESGATYSNAANAALAAQLTKFTTLTFTAQASQGGTSFQLSQRPADAGQPQLRAPGNPNQVAGSLAETLAVELGKHTTLQHTLVGAINAPQDNLGEINTAVTATLALERTYERDAFGAEARGGVAWLQPLQAETPAYKSVTSSLLGRWNHDFSANWGGSASAGVEQVYTDTGSKPLAFLPSGSANLRYALGDVAGAVLVSHGTATNLQVGSVSLTDQISAHGIYTLDSRISRIVSFSAGFLHATPLGDISPLVAAGTGDAVQGDAGFTTQIAKNVLGSARYSVAYQFNQGGGLAPTLAHIFFVGVTGSLRNTEKPLRPSPARGQRVDGSDAHSFPVVEDAPTP
ncbi:MAG TPA: hypothetical protein VFK02_32615 [Kofleriaceae bacterium]|nr:hypothetical protein [Kofleriaceae bacterium]